MNKSKKIAQLVEKHPYLEKAIFVVGSGRSGTTLMHSLLDNHPHLLVWPFEYSYYTLFNDFIAQIGRREPGLSQLNSFFYSCHLKKFRKKYHRPGVGKGYSLAAIDVGCLHRILEEYNQEVPSRKQYLQLLVYAYHQSYSPKQRPDAFVVKLHLPKNEALEDFSNAKVIQMIRNPIHTYASIKRFYFKAYESNPPAAYHLGGTNRRYKWGLIETAVVPIISSYNWLCKHRSYPGIIEVKIEDLQKKPEDVMKKVADFLNIPFTASLLEVSMLGQPFGSNLSSGADSGGKIVKQNFYDSERYIDELTPFEKYWVQRLFNEVGQN